MSKRIRWQIRAGWKEEDGKKERETVRYSISPALPLGSHRDSSERSQEDRRLSPHPLHR